MKIKTTRFISSDNEKLTVVYVLSDNNEEIKRYSFYNEPRELKIEPELETTMAELTEFLRMIYNSGLNKENITFEEENIAVD